LGKVHPNFAFDVLCYARNYGTEKRMDELQYIYTELHYYLKG